MLQQYEWDFEGVHHCLHGHQFDRFLVSNRLLSKHLYSIHDQLQKVSSDENASSFLERFDTVWLLFPAKWRPGFGYGKRYMPSVSCGTTSDAGQKGRSRVFQQGSWTQQRATYITIDSTGHHPMTMKSE